MFVASLDLGTTGCRTYIFDLAGTIIASDYQEWESFYPTPSYVEQDANAWWNSIKKTIEAAIRKSGIDKTEIVSVSVTNQRETIVPVDKEGIPLHNALVWQDRRTTDQCNQIKEKIGIDKIYETTGLTIDPYFSISKIMWFKEKKPEIYDLCENLPYIDQGELKQIIKYMDEFYKIIDNPKSTNYEFYTKCREYEGNL